MYQLGKKDRKPSFAMLGILHPERRSICVMFQPPFSCYAAIPPLRRLSDSCARSNY